MADIPEDVKALAMRVNEEADKLWRSDATLSFTAAVAAVVARLILSERAAERERCAQTVRVKPLDWKYDPLCRWWHAGPYRIEPCNTGGYALRTRPEGLFSYRTLLFGIELEAAKAAGQAHHERRVLSAIEARPVPAVPEGYVLPECATEGCGKPASVHFVRGGVGSWYCMLCSHKVQALRAPAAIRSET